MTAIAHSPKANANGTIDLILNHPEFGEIPFCASPDDSESHGRELYALALAGEFGPVAPYVAPVPTPEQLAAKSKADARAYLSSTDWYVTRLTETGMPIPDEVSTLRANARATL